MLLKYLLSVLTLSCVALGVPVTESANSASNTPRSSDESKGYIVVLNDDSEVDRLVTSLAQPLTQKIGFKYRRALKGFSGKFDALELAALRALPAVKYVVEDGIATASIVEKNSTYGLAITSQKNRLLPGKQNKYFYRPAKGAVTAYVIDTGIDITHPEFGGRATFAQDFTGEGKFDGEGHGTHVAGTIGSATYGVFKEVNLVAVKVLTSSGSGSFSAIVAGIDWVAENHEGPSVINMSLGSAYPNQALDDATKGAHDAGVVVVVAAGNSGDYGVGACEQSPAREPTAITVGAITNKYKAIGFSSEDECVDIHGPGVNVLSTYPGRRTAVLSGTSMSSPHVAGVCAYLMSQYGLSKPSVVLQTLLDNAKRGLLTNLRGAPNILANNGYFN